jgi:hypothetical protein
MANNWQSLLFDTCELGVSSAVVPALLPSNQLAWGGNIDVRGGLPSTRPNISACINLPPGLIQGAEYFGVQGGMIVASIAGEMWRLRINANSFAVEEIPLGFVNSPVIKQVWMTQTVETLVIQDGQSDAILYDGSTAVRAVYPQVPRGRQMAYGNGRLWVAVDANNVLAGDIRTNSAGSELRFTEATFFSGGGKLFFTRPITGMAFIPVTGQADYGALLIFGAGQTNAVRADITKRSDWADIPGFETAILRSVGAASQWGIVSVNQDLFWRDSNGGIRSIRNALADESGPGSAPVSREVSRITDFDSQRQLAFCSSIYFQNRLLMTASPYLLPNGGVGFKNLISLDFAPLSSMGGKSQAAYNGQWNGLRFVKLVSGDFNGKNRAFALTTDDDGNNALWEFGTGTRGDVAHECDGETVDVENPIKCFVEYPLRDFGQPKNRKRLERCDIWLSDVDGTLDLKVYWRADNSQQWLLWDEDTTCAKTTDASTVTPHVWKNLLSQYRPQFKTFTIPDDVIEQVGYAAQVGFGFQIRLVWTGQAKIYKVMLHATTLTDPDQANRETFYQECIENDVTGNDVASEYLIPSGGCPFVDIGGLVCGGDAVFGTSVGDVIDKVYTISNNGEQVLTLGTVSVSGPGYSVLAQPGITSLVHGESTTFTIRFTPGDLPESSYEGVITVPSNDPASPCVVTVTATLTNDFFFARSSGPFMFPPGAFRNPTGDQFFTQQSISGNNAVKYVAIPNNPNVVECNINPGEAAGVVETSWSGVVTYHIDTDSYSGGLAVELFENGALPGPGGNRPAGPGAIITANSIDNLISVLAGIGGVMASENYFEYQIQGKFCVREWISTSPQTSKSGYFVSGNMNSIWCVGFDLIAVTT